MTRFKTLKEFDEFCDNSMFCICNRLMTGLHMQSCRKLTNERIKVIEREKRGGEK